METFKNYCTLYCDSFNALQVVKLAEGVEIPWSHKSKQSSGKALRSPCSAHAVLLHEKESIDSNSVFFFRMVILAHA